MTKFPNITNGLISVDWWIDRSGIGLVVLQQVTGQPNILYYAEDLFQAVGFCGDVLSAMAAIGDEASYPF